MHLFCRRKPAIPAVEDITVRCRAVFACLACFAVALEAYAEQPDATVIFYLHGQIIEDQGPRPTHPQWGLYDYPAVVDALGSKGATVVSEVRDSGTDIREYARGVAKQIEEQIAAGTSPGRIVVVGFSKGGTIAVFVSSYLKKSDVSYVLLAACGDWMSSRPEIELTGHVLSIVEDSDRPDRSCGVLTDGDNSFSSFDELTIATGKEHGAFYLPRSEWLDPIFSWIEQPR